MGQKFGNDYRVWVESSTPGTYNEVKGNTELEYDLSGGTIDTTTKSSYPYSTSAPGPKGITMSAGFLPDLPDANGFTRLETLCKSTTPASIGLQIRKGGSSGASPGDVVFECAMHPTGVKKGFGGNAAVGVTFTFANAAAPTVDALA